MKPFFLLPSDQVHQLIFLGVRYLVLCRAGEDNGPPFELRCEISDRPDDDEIRAAVAQLKYQAAYVLHRRAREEVKKRRLNRLWWWRVTNHGGPPLPQRARTILA